MFFFVVLKIVIAFEHSERAHTNTETGKWQECQWVLGHTHTHRDTHTATHIPYVCISDTLRLYIIKHRTRDYVRLDNGIKSGAELFLQFHLGMCLGLCVCVCVCSLILWSSACPVRPMHMDLYSCECVCICVLWVYDVDETWPDDGHYLHIWPEYSHIQIINEKYMVIQLSTVYSHTICRPNEFFQTGWNV